MKPTLRLISVILVFVLAFTLASCDMLASFLPTGDQTGNEDNQNDSDNLGSENGNDTNGEFKEETDNNGNKPSDKDESDDKVTDTPGGEGDKDPSENEGQEGGNTPGDNEQGSGGDNVEGGDNNTDVNPDDDKTCNHTYACNVCINCGKLYISTEDANNCVHEWADRYCAHCGARCDHKFDTTTCEYCGYVSGGIDNPITIHFDGEEIPVPYSATFLEVVALYMVFDTDVEMSFINDEWAIEIDGERRTVGMYECPADYGRDVWLVYLGRDVYPGGGDSGSNPAIVYIISVIDDPAYVPFIIESDAPLSGEDIIHRAGIENPERFYIYVNSSEFYDLDSFKLMIFSEPTNIDFHLAG